jgi:hypothetical protein
VSDQKPSVGRIVHYHRLDWSQPLAAIITGVQPDGEHVFLAVFPPGAPAFFPARSIPYTPDSAHASWSWPPRVS